MRLLQNLAPLLLCALSSFAHAGFFDEQLQRDDGGIYAAQDALPIALGVAAAGCALWYGAGDKLGDTCWKAGEGAALSYGAAFGLQYAFGREPPKKTKDAHQWFEGGRGSFPSGHVAFTTALVTPFIANYFEDDPWVVALAALPIYEMFARVKKQEHWQTDVLAGAALGLAVGAYESSREHALAVTLLPGGAALSFREEF